MRSSTGQTTVSKERIDELIISMVSSSVRSAPIIQKKEARVDGEKVTEMIEEVVEAPSPEKKKRVRKTPATKKSPSKKKVKAKAKTNSKTAKGGPAGPRKNSTRTRLRKFLMDRLGKQTPLAALNKAVENGSKSLANLSAVMKKNKEKFELQFEKTQKGERTVGMYPVKR